MKKKYRIASLILAVICLLTGCAASKTVTEEVPTEETIQRQTIEIQAPEWDTSQLLPDVAEIVERGSLRVAVLDTEDNVFCYLDENGEYAGIDITIAQGIASSLGVALVINRTYESNADMIMAVQNGTEDMVISCLSLTPARAAYIHFSDPYMEGKVGLMLDKSALVELEIEKNPLDYIRTHKVRIGILQGSYYGDIISSQFPKAEIVEMESRSDMVDEVVNGNLFGFMENDIVFTDYCIHYPELALHTKTFVFPDVLDELCIGIAPEKTGFEQYVNAYLNSYTRMSIEDVDAFCKKLYHY